MPSFTRHARELWPRHPWLPVAPLALWVGLMALLGRLRLDHVIILAIAAALAYGTRRSRGIYVAVGGFIAVALLYDAMRFVQNVGLTPERVLLCGLHDFEARWFGLTTAAGRMAPHDWFLVHHHLVADLFFSVPYGTFIFVTFGYLVYLAVVEPSAAGRFGWTFFLLNVAGFITYHLVPAAPPWYFHAHGCVVDLAAHASEGTALARVDAFTGIPYFEAFYGRSSDVFGAIPSLHVAYPLLIVRETFRRQGTVARSLALGYWVWMCLAAVYLDHHWISDILLGWVYAAAAIALMTRLWPLARPQLVPRAVPSPAPVVASPRPHLEGPPGSTGEARD